MWCLIGFTPDYEKREQSQGRTVGPPPVVADEASEVKESEEADPNPLDEKDFADFSLSLQSSLFGTLLPSVYCLLRALIEVGVYDGLRNTPAQTHSSPFVTSVSPSTGIVTPHALSLMRPPPMSIRKKPVKVLSLLSLHHSLLQDSLPSSAAKVRQTATKLFADPSSTPQVLSLHFDLLSFVLSCLLLSRHLFRTLTDDFIQGTSSSRAAPPPVQKRSARLAKKKKELDGVSSTLLPASLPPPPVMTDLSENVATRADADAREQEENADMTALGEARQGNTEVGGNGDNVQLAEVGIVTLTIGSFADDGSVAARHGTGVGIARNLCTRSPSHRQVSLNDSLDCVLTSPQL